MFGCWPIIAREQRGAGPEHSADKNRTINHTRFSRCSRNSASSKSKALINIDNGPLDDHGNTIIAQHFPLIDKCLASQSVTYSVAEIVV